MSEYRRRSTRRRQYLTYHNIGNAPVSNFHATAIHSLFPMGHAYISCRILNAWCLAYSTASFRGLFLFSHLLLLCSSHLLLSARPQHSSYSNALRPSGIRRLDSGVVSLSLMIQSILSSSTSSTMISSHCSFWSLGQAYRSTH